MTTRNLFFVKLSSLPRIASLIVTLLVMTGPSHSACAEEYKSSVVDTDFDFITADDPSTFKSLKFLKFGRAEMPDKRSEDAPLFQQAFIFEASFTDQAKVKLYIDARFMNEGTAEVEARRYVDPLGKLPTKLRQGVSRLVVHQGGESTTAFSDIGLIVIYSENATRRISTHDLEETIFHESVHAAWDAKYAKSQEWKRAQFADGAFVTLYAKRKPALEDLAESALFAYTILHHPDRIPEADRIKLQKTIPHRIAFIGQLLPADQPVMQPIVDDDAAASDPRAQSNGKPPIGRRPH